MNLSLRKMYYYWKLCIINQIERMRIFQSWYKREYLLRRPIYRTHFTSYCHRNMLLSYKKVQVFLIKTSLNQRADSKNNCVYLYKVQYIIVGEKKRVTSPALHRVYRRCSRPIRFRAVKRAPAPKRYRYIWYLQQRPRGTKESGDHQHVIRWSTPAIV